MKLTSLLPQQYVKSIFLGRDEFLGETLKEEFPNHKVIRMIQTHTDQFVFIDSELKEKLDGEIIVFEDLDGIFTDQKKIVLVVKVADCFPVFFYHPIGIVGVVHAGRVGTEKKIVEKAIKYFKKEKNLDSGWIIWLGPRICKDCYQINRETDEHYDLREKNIEQIKNQLDRQANFALDCDMCTAHQNDWFYSYRKEGEEVPMNYGLVALKT